MTEEFVEFVKKTLIEKIRDSGEEIFIRVMYRKPINDKSTQGEIAEFIRTIERVASAVAGDEKAKEITRILESRLQGTKSSSSMSSTTKNVPSGVLSKEIEEFFKKFELPTETDISDYIKYLTLKYGINEKKIENDIMERAKANVRNAIITNRLKEEINGFLTGYPQPKPSDINDFINFIHLSKLNYPEDKLMQLIEKERLYRKFHGTLEVNEPTELSQFISSVKRTTDKDAIGKLMKKQGLIYLIKDDSGVSYKALTEIVDIISPAEKE